MYEGGCQVRKNCYVDCKKPFTSTNTAFVNFFSVLIKKTFANYRVSQEFVPLIQCFKAFETTLFLHQISKRR